MFHKTNLKCVRSMFLVVLLAFIAMVLLVSKIVASNWITNYKNILFLCFIKSWRFPTNFKSFFWKFKIVPMLRHSTFKKNCSCFSVSQLKKNYIKYFFLLEYKISEFLLSCYYWFYPFFHQAFTMFINLYQS
jgi:hypothetical protein